MKNAPFDATCDGTRFGTAVNVDASGDVAVVGAPAATADGVESGAVYVYDVDDRSGK